MSNVTLTQASTIVDKALEKGREVNLHPLTVVVLDAGGHLVAMKREDKSGILRTQIATGKAWGTLGMGFGGREFARRAASGGGLFLTALMEASEGRVVPAPGGVLIRDAAGDIVGAVGISGDTSDKDETCAVAGLEAAGLTPDTGETPRHMICRLDSRSMISINMELSKWRLADGTEHRPWRRLARWRRRRGCSFTACWWTADRPGCSAGKSPSGWALSLLAVVSSATSCHAGLITQRRSARLMIYAADYATMNGLLALSDRQLLRTRGRRRVRVSTDAMAAVPRKSAALSHQETYDGRPTRSRKWFGPGTVGSPRRSDGLRSAPAASCCGPADADIDAERRAHGLFGGGARRRCRRAPISGSAVATRRRSPRCARAR